MANKSEAEDALIEAVADMAAKAQAGGSTMTLEYAKAAKELAEAHAWLRAAAQPH